MRCPKCHKVYPDEYRFCLDCRTRLVQDHEEVQHKAVKTDSYSPDITTFAADNLQFIKHKVTWNVVKGEVARTIKKSEFDEFTGVSGIIIPEGVRAEIYVDGTHRASLESGIYNFVDDEAIDEILNRKVVNWKSLNGIGTKLLRGITKLVCGCKVKDNVLNSKYKDGNFDSIDQIIDYLRQDSVITVYLMVDKQFTLLFGTDERANDDSCEFSPFHIGTKYLDINVGLSLLFQIDDFKQIIQNFLLSQDTVTTRDVQALLGKYLPHILEEALKDVDIEKDGLPTDLKAKLAFELDRLSNFLCGFKVVGIGRLSYSSQDLDRFSKIAKELYRSEKEIDFLHRTNEFKNRLSSIINEQHITEAKNSLEIKNALDEINHDGLLHEEEEWLFHTLLKNQRTISEAKNKLEVDKALSQIRQTGLLNNDEEVALEESLEFKRFDRKNIALTMRAQSIASSVKQRLEIQAELNGIKFAQNIDFEKLKEEKQADLDIHRILNKTQVDDAAFVAKKHQMANELEELDITAIIYGKQFQQEKKELQDKIDLSLMSFHSQLLKEKELADHKNDILQSEIEGRKIADDYEWEKKTKETDFEINRRIKENNVSAIEKGTEIDLEYNKKEKDLELIEKKRKGALEALARMKAIRNAEAENEFHRNLEMEKINAIERERKAQLEYELKLKDIEFKNEQDRRNHELDERKVDAERQMTSEQLVARDISRLTAEAQVSFTSQYSSAKENEYLKMALEREEQERRRQEAELLRRENSIKEDNKRIVDTILAENARNDQVKMDFAKSMMGMSESFMGRKSEELKEERDYERSYQRESMDRMERVVTHRMDETHSVDNRRYEDVRQSKEEYRQQMMHQQQRLDDQQDKALDYTTRSNTRRTQRESDSHKNESANDIFMVEEMGDVPFTLTQLVRLVSNGIINKRSIIIVHGTQIYAEDIPELKQAFDECDFVVCPHCHFKVPEKGKFCPKCGEDLY